MGVVHELDVSLPICPLNRHSLRDVLRQVPSKSCVTLTQEAAGIKHVLGN